MPVRRHAPANHPRLRFRDECVRLPGQLRKLWAYERVTIIAIAAAILFWALASALAIVFRVVGLEPTRYFASVLLIGSIPGLVGAFCRVIAHVYDKRNLDLFGKVLAALTLLFAFVCSLAALTYRTQAG